MARRNINYTPLHRAGAQYVVNGAGMPLINGNPQFASESILYHFRNKFSNSPVHRGSGVDLDNCGATFGARVDAHEWESVVMPPNRCNGTIVREFYAFLKGNPGAHYATVRGCSFSISPAAINEYFSLQDLKGTENEFTTTFDKSANWIDDIGAFYSITWDVASRATTFPETAFSQWEDRLLHRFICSDIEPSGHTSTVYYPQAALMYWFQQGWPIDLGEFMHRHMHEVSKKGRAVLPYGSMIHDFALAVECPYLPGDEFIDPKPILSYATVPPVDRDIVRPPRVPPQRRPSTQAQTLSNISARLGNLERTTADIHHQVSEWTRRRNDTEAVSDDDIPPGFGPSSGFDPFGPSSSHFRSFRGD